MFPVLVYHIAYSLVKIRMFNKRSTNFCYFYAGANFHGRFVVVVASAAILRSGKSKTLEFNIAFAPSLVSISDHYQF